MANFCRSNKRTRNVFSTTNKKGGLMLTLKVLTPAMSEKQIQNESCGAKCNCNVKLDL